MDGLNIFGQSRDVVIVGVGKSQLDDYVKRLSAAQGRTVVPEPTPERGYYYRSDQFSFARQGLPMAYFESGEDLVKGGRAAGHAASEDFVAHRYHSPKDQYDPAWDWAGAVQDLALYYSLGRELADSDAWPEWSPNAEFRAIREKSRAGK
jgi:Zn-dependent M28 family amino/carboxypeptidase